MGTSWAVGAAATLALAAWLAPSPTVAFTLVGAPQPSAVLQWILGIAALGTWAYAIAMSAHGNKGAVLALLVDVLAALVAALAFLANIGASAGIVALAVVAAASAVGLASELRSRRGGVQWGAAAVYALPTILLVGWQVRLVLQPVTR